MDRVSISKCPTKIKPELPPELKVESRGVMNKPKIFKNSIGPINRVSIMNVKHDMALFLIGRLRVVGVNYFKPVDLQLVCLAMDI